MNETQSIFFSYNIRTPNRWRLERDFTADTMMGPITVPAGFIWDSASVPRIFWNIIPPWGSWASGALVHDYLYKHHPFERYKADAVFFGLMIRDNVVRWRAVTMWAAVRCFGWYAWSRRA
jgi:hypothetical protein